MEIVEYLISPPNVEELTKIVEMVGNVQEIIRKKEPLFKDKFSGKKFSEKEWIEILCANPILIERPIIVDGNKAVVGRSEEKLQEILKE